MELEKTKRFDYVKYDEQSEKLQADFKACFVELSSVIDQVLIAPRAKALVQTKLEEAYMWIGKALRDDQVIRNKATELQEGRNDS